MVLIAPSDGGGGVTTGTTAAGLSASIDSVAETWTSQLLELGKYVKSTGRGSGARWGLDNSSFSCTQAETVSKDSGLGSWWPRGDVGSQMGQIGIDLGSHAVQIAGAMHGMARLHLETWPARNSPRAELVPGINSPVTGIVRSP